MNSVEDLKINTATQTKRSKSSLTESNAVISEPAECMLDSGIDQYSPFDNFCLDDINESANENNFKSLFGRFQFRREPDLPRSHAAIDLILTVLCFATVHIVYLGSLNLTSHRSVALFSALVLISLSLYIGGMHSTKRLKRLSQEITSLAVCWAFAFAAIGLFAFLSKTAGDVSRVWITSSMVLSLVSLAGVRILGSFGFMARNKSRGRNIVILGNALHNAPILDNLKNLSNSQIKLARFFHFSAHPSEAKNYTEALNISAGQLSQFIENKRQSGAAIEQVWIAISENQSRVVQEITAALIDSSVDVCVIPDQYTERLLKGDVTRIGDTNVVNVSEVSLSLGADQIKRVFDMTVASLALLILAIPMLFIAAFVKLESKGPVLFRQKRYGVDGREIEVFKFRSMHVHSDSNAQQATKNDSRITGIGKIIRRTSLDELPQLLNVLNGSMSLVGPRPHAVAHNEVWRTEIQGYMLRHKVRPGITGWAQVNGWRGETDTAYKMQQRVKYDLEYIRYWSMWLDLKILILTIFVGFLHRNAY